MSYSVLYTENFLNDARRLAKKYTSFKNDLQGLIKSHELNPTKGTPLGLSYALPSQAKERANLEE